MRNNEMSLYPLRAVQVHPPLANFVAVPVNGDLRRLLSLPAESKGVETAMDHEGFHNGWNAELRHMRQHSDTLLPEIERLIFNDPATIVYWSDGTKTVVKCQQGDTFSAETGLMAAMLKRFMGNDNSYNKVINYWLATTHQPALPKATEDHGS